MSEPMESLHREAGKLNWRSDLALAPWRDADREARETKASLQWRQDLADDIRQGRDLETFTVKHSDRLNRHEIVGGYEGNPDPNRPPDGRVRVFQIPLPRVLR